MSATPAISPPLRRWFGWYARRYLKRHFNAFRLLRSAAPPPEEPGPRVFFLNHASWWDPLVALHLADRFTPHHQTFAPMDAAALQRYRFMNRLGFFPVERDSARGARQFLRSAKSILSEPNHALWLTPQGHFRDVRERPVRFQAGLAHLAEIMPEVPMVPVAIEYTWWFERSPEVLVAFGKPFAGLPNNAEERLAAVQDQLASASMSRSPDDFETLLSGRAGVGGIYDGWRTLRARLRGETFTTRHHSP